MVGLTLRSINRILALAVFLLFVFVLYRLFGPINPASFQTLNVPTNQSLQSGAPLTYTSSACRYVNINVQTTVVRSLVPANDPTLQPIPLSTDTTSGAPRCHTATRQVILPTATPAGCYRLTIKAIYLVAFYRAPIAREITSNKFCVVVPPEADQLLQLQTQVNSLEESIKALEDTAGLKATTAVPSAAKTTPQPRTSNTVTPPESVSTTSTSTSTNPPPSPTPQPAAPASILQTVERLVNLSPLF